jgi:hypothetical protein
VPLRRRISMPAGFPAAVHAECTAFGEVKGAWSATGGRVGSGRFDQDSH